MLGLLYVLVAYAFVIGYGTGGVAQGVAAQFDGEVASAFYPLTDRYAGPALTHAFEALILTSAFACQLAFFNTAARYLFALGREGILPRAHVSALDRASAGQVRVEAEPRRSGARLGSFLVATRHRRL